MVDISDQEKPAFFSKQSFLFLFPARQSHIERVFVILLGPLYVALLMVACSKQSFKWVLCPGGFATCGHWQGIEDQAAVLLFLTLLVTLLSSYSLISRPISESTPYATDDSFSLLSHHYQRILYQVILFGIMFTCQQYPQITTFLGINTASFIWIYWANLVCLILQMLGILGNFFVTLAYLGEQMNIFGFGSTSRASDSRIFINVLLNCIFVAILIFLPQKVSFISSNHSKSVLALLLAYLASTNLIFTLGIK